MLSVAFHIVEILVYKSIFQDSHQSKEAKEYFAIAVGQQIVSLHIYIRCFVLCNVWHPFPCLVYNILYQGF